MSDFDSLYVLCREFLEAARDALALTAAGAPARSYVSAGMPAFDCEQLTVYPGGPSESMTEPLNPPIVPGYRADITGRMNEILMTCTVLRCAPAVTQTGNAPSAQVLDDNAKLVLGDVWAIWNHIATLRIAQQLWMPKTRAVFYHPAVPINTQGGVAGWEIPLSVELEGFRTQ